ncbi:glycosyltransferase family 2 protein [Leifsonia aquatica]|uniref:glycosyltransferase family 2 protein n=1 Tax=Leifsonia aquatica TaxID=144185 RepID=UPI0038255A84
MSGPVGFVRRAGSAVAWRWAMRRYRAGRFSATTVLRHGGPAEIAVVMCLWNRRDRIDAVLTQLDGQRGLRVKLILWNNRPSDDAHYRERIAAYSAHGSLAEVSFISSRVNVGGLGRFFVARRLRTEGYRGPFVMLDDDQDVGETLVTDLVSASGPHIIAGYWAWTMAGDYWARTPAEPGDRVSYVGTGGCACDIDIVADLSFFTELPRYFAFLEDIWMCGYARHRGWVLRKVDTPIEFVLDETNQHHTLAERKAEFYRYLRLDDGV